MSISSSTASNAQRSDLQPTAVPENPGLADGRSRPPDDEASPVNKWVITASVTVGTLMGAIDSSIVNVALPHIQAAMGVTVTEITWLVTAYLISMVLVMPLTAWLGTVFGRKTVYQACLVIFVAASVVAGFSTNLHFLLVARLLQGLGAGALQPTEQAILRETFPVEEQGLAMGLYGLAVMIGPAVGPTMGGYIVDNYGWRWIFFINLPVGIIGSLLVARFVHEPHYIKARRATVDLPGILLLSVGLSTLLVVLEEGNRWDWFASRAVWALSAMAAVSLILFVLWELYGSPHPAVDLRLFTSRSFTSGTALGGLLGVNLYGALLLLPLFLQSLLGYDATQSGIALMPRALAMLVMMPFSGLLYNRLGPHLLISSGLVLAAWSMFDMGRFTLQSPNAEILIPQVVSGVGFALMFVALSTTTLARVERRRMSSATGLYNLVRQVGGSFGTAIFATMLERETFAQHARLVQYATPANPAFGHWMGALKAAFMAHGSDAVRATQQALAALDGMIARQASVLAFEHDFQVVAVWMLASLPLVFLLQRPRGTARTRTAE